MCRQVAVVLRRVAIDAVAATIARAALQCTGVARQFVADACRHVADQQAAGQMIAVAADVQRVVAAVCAMTCSSVNSICRASTCIPLGFAT